MAKYSSAYVLYVSFVLVQLGISKLTAIYCTKMMSKHNTNLKIKDTNLEGSLIIYTYSKKKVVVIYMTYDLSNLDFLTWFIYSNSCVFPPLWGLKSNQKTVGCPHYTYVILVPFGISCHTRCYCSSQNSHLTQIVDNFSPSPPCISPSHIVKTWQQGKAFNSSSPCPMTYD